MSMLPLANEPRLVIEFPHALSGEAVAHIRGLLADLSAGHPLVLEEGARVRVIGADGRITPNDEPTVIVQVPWWGIIIGGAIGSAVTALLMAVLS